jgi:hypothetical protein
MTGASAPSSPLPILPILPSFKTALPRWQRSELPPCKRYAALSSSECKASIQQQQLPVKGAQGKTVGISTPLQLTGPLRGVSFELPRTLYGFLDCRLVLILSELSTELQRFGVVSVVVNNTYRPASVRPSKTLPPAATVLPKSKSKRGVQPAAAKPSPEPARLSQHASGLAVDITEFRLRDGRTLNVERDWRGIRGAPACGAEAQVVEGDPAAILLRDITCAIARAGLCNHLITPNRDDAHKNHLHCDIEADASEVMLD